MVIWYLLYINCVSSESSLYSIMPLKLFGFLESVVFFSHFYFSFRFSP